MKKGVWLSYDLSAKGDYDGLYSWLDNHKAKECGDSIAYILWEDNGTDDIADQIRTSLSNSFDYDKRKDRIYLIYKKKDKMMTGKFVFGNRRANPWEGCGSSEEEEEDYEIS